MAASFRIILYAIVCITGILVGLEIPLLMRILKDKVEFKELVSRVFTFDYIGALLASLVFPLVLVPQLGLIRTALFFGMLNIGVGWYLAHYFSREIKQATTLKTMSVLLLLVELLAFVFSEKIMSYSESMTFTDNIVYSTSSPYQRIVLTRNRRETRLFLNGNLQFSSADEYRYHEALVHPALSSVKKPENVLVLGGGDGFAVREILKYPSVKNIILVDLDSVITSLFKTQEVLLQLNHRALLDEKVTVYNADAFEWLKNNKDIFDAIVIDFPDPSNFSIGKLYSTAFYSILKNSVSNAGIVVIQSTSPYAAPRSFWCVDATLKACGLFTRAYHNYVPSFGEWGYIMAMKDPGKQWFDAMPADLKYLNASVLPSMFVFPEDMKTKEVTEPNRLNNQVLVHYFEEEWDKFVD